MNKQHHSHYFLLLALSASLLLVYLIVQPFLSALIMAGICAFLFQPVYRKSLRVFRGSETLSALATTFLAVVLVLLPIALLGSQIFKESAELYQALAYQNAGGFADSIETIVDQARAMLPIPVGFEVDVKQYATQGLELVIQNLGTIFSSFARMLLGVFVFLTAFYFFLKDGRALKAHIVALSPLDDKDDEFIASRLKAAVSAAVKGNIAIRLIQGFLTGLGFAIFGVPNPVLWGGVASVTAFLPGIGTALIITPAIIFLLLAESTGGAIGLLLWGVVVVGLTDNLLGPRLVGHGMQLHPLAVFISVLGGLAFFGPLGFILGPLTVSGSLALIEIYSSLKAREA